MQSLTIPVQRYRKETAAGQMPDCVRDAWQKIWSTEMPRKFGYDFEVYDARSRDRSSATVDIYISVTE